MAWIRQTGDRRHCEVREEGFGGKSATEASVGFAIHGAADILEADGEYAKHIASSPVIHDVPIRGGQCWDIR